MPLLALLVGAALGGVLGHRFESIVAGPCIGFIAGYVFESWRDAQRAPPQRPAVDDPRDPLSLLDPRVAERMRAMERRIAALEASMRRPSSSEATPHAVPPARPAPIPPAAPVATARSPMRDDERPTTQAHRRDTPVQAVPAYAAPRAFAHAPAPRDANAIRRWITGGNTLARAGVVVLFIGVAFLLKCASEHVTIPIEARLSAVALGGVAMVVFGWRLRGRRAGYAMTLQGAGIGILYLTVFAALRLYQLLPPVGAFGLLFGIAELSSFLAIRQDSMALAVLGVLGGFAAPILTSSGGSHLMLFSYCAVLNAALLAIAWFKTWRVLNIVGFACTVIVGVLWGATAYRPEDFATTEPFLILFFLFYVAIATLYALRSSLELRRHVDATLVFGTPLVAASLQGALVHHIAYAMAWSAIGASAIYLLLARMLHARWREVRLLEEAYLALGVAFATLAVPLALDARLTSATWALEGAALVWVGVRQAHRSARVFGLLLQLGAGVAFALGFSLWTDRWVGGSVPVLNSDCLGALLVACGALVSARALARATPLAEGERSLAPIVFGWGLAWWLGGGWQEIERFAGADARVAVLVAFLAGSAVSFAALATRLDWPMARVPALALPAALLAIAVADIAQPTMSGGHLLAAGGVIAWPVALAIGVLLLRHFEHHASPARGRAVDAGHAILAWLVTLIAAHELAWLARSNLGGPVWRLVPWGLVPALMLMAIASLTTRASWPFGPRARAYLLGGGIAIAAAAIAWTLYANITSAGDPAPLPYLPLANPFDLVQALVFVAVARWLSRVHDLAGGRPAYLSADALGAAAAALLLFWVTCSTLRSVHHLADVPWSLAPLWASRVVQSALSIVWSLFALAAMVVANRRGYRIAWVAGAALLGVVVAKLFAVDLSQVGGVERIVSFIGVGGLLLVVGYMAPVPPRQEAR